MHFPFSKIKEETHLQVPQRLKRKKNYERGTIFCLVNSERGGKNADMRSSKEASLTLMTSATLAR